MWWSEGSLPWRRRRARRRCLLVALAVGAVGAVGASGCDPGYSYGVAGGVAGPLAPAQAGGYASLAIKREFDAPARSIANYFTAEGSIAGWASTDSRGLAPMLVGAGGAKSGAFRLYVEGGVHLLGALERWHNQVFSIFGLVGGAGLGVALGDHVEIHLGGRILWSSPSTQVDINKDADPSHKKEWLYFFGGLSIQIRPKITPLRPLEDPL
jgi:hypothetical protein